jgi:hypothetical protein
MSNKLQIKGVEWAGSHRGGSSRMPEDRPRVRLRQKDGRLGVKLNRACLDVLGQPDRVRIGVSREPAGIVVQASETGTGFSCPRPGEKARDIMSLHLKRLMDGADHLVVWDEWLPAEFDREGRVVFVPVKKTRKS